MTCKGKCQLQIYDVDIDDVKFKLITNPPGDCTSRPDSEIDYVIHHFFQPYLEKLSGCDDPSCNCVPTEENPKWTDWQEYMAPTEPVKLELFENVHCEYKVSGYYYVSSAVVDGVCMKSSLSFHERRMRSNRHKWWKQKKEDRGKPKKWF